MINQDVDLFLRKILRLTHRIRSRKDSPDAVEQLSKELTLLLYEYWKKHGDNDFDGCIERYRDELEGERYEVPED